MFISNVFQVIAVLRLAVAAIDIKHLENTSRVDASNFKEQDKLEEMNTVQHPPNVVAPPSDVPLPGCSFRGISDLNTPILSSRKITEEGVEKTNLPVRPFPPAEQDSQQGVYHTVASEDVTLDSSEEQNSVPKVNNRWNTLERLYYWLRKGFCYVALALGGLTFIILVIWLLSTH